MIDNSFRGWLPSYIDFILRLFRRLGFTPNQISLVAFAISVLSVFLLLRHHLLAAGVVWWISRLFDACDGIYARKYNLTSNFGAYLDIQLDMAAYSLMVIAFAIQFPQFQLQWMLMLFFYVLCITGALGLGHFEDKLKLTDKGGRGLRLASGLAEGGETGIAYTVFLLFPHLLAVTTWFWIAILLITVMARLILARKQLK